MPAYVLHPPKDPVKVLKDRLKVEERFEAANRLPSFRVHLIKELITEIQNQTSK